MLNVRNAAGGPSRPEAGFSTPSKKRKEIPGIIRYTGEAAGVMLRIDTAGNLWYNTMMFNIARFRTPFWTGQAKRKETLYAR